VHTARAAGQSKMDNRFSYREHESSLTPDLGSESGTDLEWMLHTSQAPLPVLASALVEEFYPPVYRLALALLHEPEQARRALPDLFSAALQQRHRYTGREPAPVWLFQRVLERLLSRSPTRSLHTFSHHLRPQPRSDPPPIQPEHPTEAALWACVDRLPLPSRALLFLTQVLGWDVSQAGQALQLEQEQAGTLLLQARGRCTAASAWEGVPGDAPVRSPEWLRESLQRHWPAPEALAPEALAALAAQAAARAERQAHGSRKVILVKEVGLVALTVALVGSALWGMSQLDPQPPLEEGLFLTHTTRPTGTREPTPTPTRAFYSEPFPQGVFYTVLPGDTWEQAAARLGTSAAELLRLNRIPPDAPPEIGQRLLIPGRLTPQAVPAGASPEFFQPTPAPPLSSEVTLEEAFLRLEQTFYRDTLWMDVRVRAYAPPGISASPVSYQLQLWLKQGTGETAGMAGREGEPPSLAFIQPMGVSVKPNSREPWFRPVPESAFHEAMVLPMRILYQAVPFGGHLPFTPEQMENQGYDPAYGTPTLMFTGGNRSGETEFRVWLDARTGWPVRQQTFIREKLVLDVEFAGIDTHFPFPYGVFDPWLPWRGGFAANANGDPIPYEEDTGPPRPSPQPTRAPIIPLAGFDPAGSPLTIHYLEAPDWTVSGWENWLWAQVIAGPYLVAETQLPDPQILVCQRSTNGEILVFGQMDYWDLDQSTVSGLRWLDLTRRNEMLALDPDLEVEEFAVSPDGRYLAVTQSNVLVDRVTLFDLRSGAVHHDERIDGPANLAWSPDGRYLAISSTVRANARQGPVNLLVYEVDTWEQAFSAQMAQSPGEEVGIHPEAPVLTWGIEYPPLPFQQRLCIP
jgi:DNA-directed RNA polymerase specialized sigma24 family protein